MPKSRDAFRTISEVADWLETPPHVLRFWESKFTQVKPVKRAGGRRYYRPGDMELLGGIKKLLHDDGMTIKGVQKVLREQGVRHVAALSVLQVDPDDSDEAELIEDAPYIEVPLSEEPDSVIAYPSPAPEPGSLETPSEEEVSPEVAAWDGPESPELPFDSDPVAAAQVEAEAMPGTEDDTEEMREADRDSPVFEQGQAADHDAAALAETTPEPDVSAEAGTEPEPEVEIERDLEAEIEPEPEPEAEIEPEPEAELQHEPAVEIEPEPEAETHPEPEAEMAPEPEPEPYPQTEAEPQAEIEPAAEPALSSEAARDPEPEPEVLDAATRTRPLDLPDFNAPAPRPSPAEADTLGPLAYLARITALSPVQQRAISAHLPALRALCESRAQQG